MDVIAWVIGAVLAAGVILGARRRVRRLPRLSRGADPDEGEMGLRNVARTLPALRRADAHDPQAGFRTGSIVGRMDL
jgi:hypothetical protein